MASVETGASDHLAPPPRIQPAIPSAPCYQASPQRGWCALHALPTMLSATARPQLAGFRPTAARNVQQLSRARAPLRLYASAEQQEERSLAQK